MGKLASTEDHLAAYGGVDIALDTFPTTARQRRASRAVDGRAGGALAGDRHAARVGASMLARVGLGDLVAASPEAYVETAARLAADQPALARLRADLRGRIANSPLFDGRGFSRELEAAYRTMWREWCGRGRAGHVQTTSVHRSPAHESRG